MFFQAGVRRCWRLAVGSSSVSCCFFHSSYGNTDAVAGHPGSRHWLLRQRLLPNLLVGVSGEWGGCRGWIGCFAPAFLGAGNKTNNPEESWQAPSSVLVVTRSPLIFSQKLAASVFLARNRACINFGCKYAVAGCLLGSRRKKLFLETYRGDCRTYQGFWERQVSPVRRRVVEGMCISRPLFTPRQKSQRVQRVLHSSCFSQP